MADKKFSPMRYSASTEEAAINGALQIVGVSRDEIEIEVLDRSEKGVTVRIKPRSSEAPTAPVEPPAPAPAPVEVPVEVPVAAAPEPEPAPEVSPIVEDVPELLAQDEAPETEASEVTTEEAENEEEDSDSDSDSDYDAPTSENESEEDSEEEGAPVAEAAPPVQVVEHDPQVVENARATAQDFLDRMGLEASAHQGAPVDATSISLVIEGDDVGILIGKHGATLQSFQYLLNLTLNAHIEGEGTRVVVDAGNYRARRQSSLEQTARSAASKARRENRAIRLEPMPAHERRLVHMFLQTEADIATQSEGREPMRRIVVSPATGGRPSTPRSSGRGGDRTHSNSDRSSSERSGMGGYRRGDANSERNRGLQRGR